VLHEQPRDGSLAREGIGFASPAMIFTPGGLMLGAGTILVPAEGMRKLQSLQGREQQILALLSAAYGTAVAPSVLGNIERAAKSWSESDDFTAHIHLAHTGLRALDDFPSAAHRLCMAKGALDHGASPRAVFEALRLDARYIDALEKRYNPEQPRVPAGHPDGGQWTSGDGSSAGTASSHQAASEQQVLSDATPDNPWKPGAQYAANEPPPGIGHNQGPPLEDPPKIPEVPLPFNTRAFWGFVKVATQWLIKAGWRPVLPIAIRMELEATAGGRIGLFLATMEAAYWTYRAYPYIHSYFDPPKALEDLRQNIGLGYDGHHIVERWSSKDGIPEAWIESPANVVRIPKLKHWEINSWLDTSNPSFTNDKGEEMSPREYMKGKNWEERYEFGLKVLRDFGVLKP
jgi:hypothetical protein